MDLRLFMFLLLSYFSFSKCLSMKEEEEDENVSRQVKCLERWSGQQLKRSVSKALRSWYFNQLLGKKKEKIPSHVSSAHMALIKEMPWVIKITQMWANHKSAFIPDGRSLMWSDGLYLPPLFLSTSFVFLDGLSAVFS